MAQAEWVQKRFWLVKDPSEKQKGDDKSVPATSDCYRPLRREELGKVLEEVLVEIRARNGCREKAIAQGLIEALMEQLTAPDTEFCNEGNRCAKLRLLKSLALSHNGRNRLFSNEAGATEACATLLKIIETCGTDEEKIEALKLFAIEYRDPRVKGLCDCLCSFLKHENALLSFAAVKALRGASMYRRIYSPKDVKHIVKLFQKAQHLNDKVLRVTVLTDIVKCLVNIAAEIEMKDLILEAKGQEQMENLINTEVLLDDRDLCLTTVELVASLATCMKNKLMDTSGIEEKLVALLLAIQTGLCKAAAPKALPGALKTALVCLGESKDKMLRMGKQIMDSYPRLLIDVFGERKSAEVASPYLEHKMIGKNQSAIDTLTELIVLPDGPQAIWRLPRIIDRLVHMMMCEEVSQENSDRLVEVLEKLCKSFHKAGVMVKTLADQSMPLRRRIKQLGGPLKDAMDTPLTKEWVDPNRYE